MVIQVNIVNKRAAIAGAPVIVCGNSGYTVEFTFDKDWDGMEYKTVRFVYVQTGEVKYQDIVFTGTTVEVPVMENTKELRVGVFAGDLRTSTPAVIPCELSIRCGTGAPADPTPSQYDQIMALLLYGGSGIGTSAASLLIEILRGAVYNTDQSAYIDALEAALCGGTVPDLPDTPDTPDNPVNPDAETIPLSVVLGTAARVDGQKLTYDPTQTIRGATNPLAFYVEEGKTYTVSLSSYENYGFYPQGLSYSTSGTDFTVVDGTEKIFHGDFTRTLAPGWQYADYTFTADGTYQVIALQFRNITNTALTADDITALNGLLTVTVE